MQYRKAVPDQVPGGGEEKKRRRSFVTRNVLRACFPRNTACVLSSPPGLFPYAAPLALRRPYR
jgi:hypothetical protein